MAAESGRTRTHSALARPVQFYTGSEPRTICCPHCLNDVEPIGAPFVPVDLLDGRLAQLVDDGLPVRGYECDQCDLILPAHPQRDDLDVGPGTGWTAVRATFRDGYSKHIIVPQREVEQ